MRDLQSLNLCSKYFQPRKQEHASGVCAKSGFPEMRARTMSAAARDGQRLQNGVIRSVKWVRVLVRAARMLSLARSFVAKQKGPSSKLPLRLPLFAASRCLLRWNPRVHFFRSDINLSSHFSEAVVSTQQNKTCPSCLAFWWPDSTR